MKIVRNLALTLSLMLMCSFSTEAYADDKNTFSETLMTQKIVSEFISTIGATNPGLYLSAETVSFVDCVAFGLAFYDAALAQGATENQAQQVGFAAANLCEALNLINGG